MKAYLYNEIMNMARSPRIPLGVNKGRRKGCG
jgi:hypothetical protein